MYLFLFIYKLTTVPNENEARVSASLKSNLESIQNKMKQKFLIFITALKTQHNIKKIMPAIERFLGFKMYSNYLRKRKS